MKLSELLYKYKDNSTLKIFLDNAINSPTLYAKIIEGDNIVVTPTNLFLNAMSCNKLNIVLDNDLNLVSSECACLHFYNNKECIHIAALYAVSLILLDEKKYNTEYELYKEMLKKTLHNNVIDFMSSNIKIANPYFNSIHLIPVVEVIQGDYVLSLKIGYDKDYIIKNIYDFILATENNNIISYGQRLEFIHSYECFDDISKELYTFVTNISNENTQKCLKIRKSHLLKILEIYNGNTIFFRSSSEFKPQIRFIEDINKCDIELNNKELRIVAPEGSTLLVSGVRRAYFLANDRIYAYSFKNKLENKIINSLYKVEGNLNIELNSNNFISNLLPLIRNQITITDDFYNKYPVPNIKINSYLSYSNEVIFLQPKISCKEIERQSPYLREMLDSYFKVIEGYKFKKGNTKSYIINDIQAQYELLTSDLSSIKAFGEIFFDDSVKRIKARKSKKTFVNISYNVGLLDFRFESENLTPDDIKAMLLAYKENKHFVRLKDDTILEIDDDKAKEILDFLEDFNISIKDIDKPISKPLNYVLKLVNGVDNNLSLDDNIIKMINTIQNYHKSKYMPNDSFKNLLREYQLLGFKWLKTLAEFKFGGILADDMGLGKTLEIISFIDSDNENKPSLIVCPMSLVYNWENECEKWNFNNDVKLILGSIEERNDLITNIDDNKKVLYITSYDSLRRDVSLYKSHFRFIIADEAQFIKNQYAQKSEAIKSLDGEIRFALTGTPIENGLQDLWSIFDFLMPGYLQSYNHFKSRYESLIIHDDREALDNLKKRVNPFILRRTKKDVLNDLPDKIEEYYYYKMDKKQRDVYTSYVDKLKDDLKNDGNNVLALLTRLRQVCITPELIMQEHFENTKINMALDIVKSSILGGHRILLFSQFSQSFPLISKELDELGIRHFILDGTTKAKNRIEMVDEFNQNKDIKVFLISLKAGGTGLNLVGADMVIHLDPWWNQSAEMQASDRAYRIGQTKNVYVIKLICKNTIEEKVVELQKIKTDLANSVVQDGIKLSKQDILGLLD